MSRKDMRVTNHLNKTLPGYHTGHTTMPLLQSFIRLPTHFFKKIIKTTNLTKFKQIKNVRHDW